MFHTMYSLIWVRMLYDVYMIGGNFDLLKKCRDALDLLLARFDTYIGENGLIENPPDYMFVDWIYIDGLSMHHPPKALGQTVLNMFYFMALRYSELIYGLIGDTVASLQCGEKKKELQKAVNTLLYDSDAGMYFEGLNTPISSAQINKWQPQNVEKRYYLKHSNIMAAYTSICDHSTARSLIEKIMNDEIEGNVQPYFQHYLLEAIEKHGLKDKYSLQVIERWKQAVKDCNKGLVEGFFAPEPTYHFDNSHAWGGSPLYSLPKALTGLSIEEAFELYIQAKNWADGDSFFTQTDGKEMTAITSDAIIERKNRKALIALMERAYDSFWKRNNHAPLYADCEIRFKDDGTTTQITITMDSAEHKNDSFYYCNSFDGLKGLTEPDNCTDFIVTSFFGFDN